MSRVYHGGFRLVDFMLILAGVAVVIFLGATAKAYSYLRKAQMEYEKARSTFEDVILSFKREIRREAERLELVAYKVEAVSAKSEKALEMAESIGRKFESLEPKVIKSLAEREQVLSKLEDIDKKARDVVASHESFAAKLSALEEQAQQFVSGSEARVEAVIPIKRERALAPLTETELTALEMLAKEGPKTAPEIKERLRLSREHTARLMKKLYEAGYLERDSSKIPFKYSVKKEMEKFLKKPESEASQSA